MASSTMKSRVVVLAGVAAAVAAAAAVMHTDLMLSRGFGNALDASRPGLSFETAAGKPSARTPSSTGGPPIFGLSLPATARIESRIASASSRRSGMRR